MLDSSRNITYLYGMNNLPIEKKAQIIQLLVEGCSLRSTSRIADVSINTVTKLLVDVGKACEEFHNEKVTNIKSERIQCDEIWSFVYSKEKNTTSEMKEEGAGDAWTWTALDADSKLIVSWYVGDRDAESAFSKKIENHCCAIALHFVYYNFVKIHKSLSVTPAMQAGITKRLMSIEDIVRLVPEPVAAKRGNYKKGDKNSN